MSKKPDPKSSKPSKSTQKSVEKSSTSKQPVSKDKSTKTSKQKAEAEPVAVEAMDRTPLATFHNLNQIIKEQFAVACKNKMTTTQFELLNAIASFDGPPSQTQLAELTGIDRSTTADTLRRLSKSGHLTKIRSIGDERAFEVSMTDSGKKLHAIGVAAAEKVIKVITEVPGYQQATSWANKFVKAHMFTEKPDDEDSDEGDEAPAKGRKDSKSGYSDERDDSHTQP